MKFFKTILLFFLFVIATSAKAQSFTIQAESMTTAGQYAGKISSPFAGVAYYANNDRSTITVNFPDGSGNYDISIRGASNNSNNAGISLYIKAGKSARELILVIRERAGKWRWDNNGNVAKVADNSAAMIAATPATIDINYILAERSREYYGEGYRWFDLVRTQKWNELAGSYQICGTGYGDRTPITVTRTIEPKHYLRPIPSGQIDGMEMTDAEKAAYQNPGY
jgi:hypothetical protein